MKRLIRQAEKEAQETQETRSLLLTAPSNSMIFFGVIDGVFGNFNRHVGLRQKGLAAQT